MTTYLHILIALASVCLTFLIIAIHYAIKGHSEMDAQDKKMNETDEMLHAWWETGKDWEQAKQE